MDFLNFYCAFKGFSLCVVCQSNFSRVSQIWTRKNKSLECVWLIVIHSRNIYWVKKKILFFHLCLGEQHFFLQKWTNNYVFVQTLIFWTRRVLFFGGERFAREFVAKLVYVLSAHELMSCSVVQQKAKGKKCWKRKFRMYTKKKNSVSSENSFYFLSSENK